jgi:hypothetical protein
MELKRENCQQKASRKTRNLWFRCKGLGQTTNVQAKLALKEAQLTQCKKAFGVAYMELVEKGATGEDLQACVDACTLQAESIRGEIALLRDRKVYIREKTENRIWRSSNSWSTPSVRVTPTSSPPSMFSHAPSKVDLFHDSAPTWVGDAETNVQHVSFDAPFEPSAPPARYDRK